MAAGFHHSGKLGDIVYGLAAVSAFEEAHFYVNANGAYMSPSAAQSILPLIRAQLYISEADIWNSQPFDYNLDRFREFDIYHSNLADCHLQAVGLPSSHRDRPWLSIDSPTRVKNRDVVFARSLVHRGSPGIWEPIYAALGHRAFFIGLPTEHEAFVREIGQVPYVPTNNLLDVARLIAGSVLFVGNQSCPLAIAEAMKHPLIQEVYSAVPNCIFERPDCFPVWNADEIPQVMSQLTESGVLD